jgi:hypothetical protein
MDSMAERPILNRADIDEPVFLLHRERTSSQVLAPGRPLDLRTIGDLLGERPAPLQDLPSHLVPGSRAESHLCTRFDVTTLFPRIAPLEERPHTAQPRRTKGGGRPCIIAGTA